MARICSPVRRVIVPALVAALLAGVLAPSSVMAQHRYGGWGGGYRHGGWGYGYGGVVGVLPALATVLTIGAITYWVADGQYYRAAPAGGYVVVAPPAGVAAPAAGSDAAPPNTDRLYIYPRDAQPADKQAADEYDCHKWAVGQTGFDPVAVSSGGAISTEQKRHYQRAQSACLDARGYTVR
jgi:hypothetical protein